MTNAKEQQSKHNLYNVIAAIFFVTGLVAGLLADIQLGILLMLAALVVKPN